MWNKISCLWLWTFECEVAVSEQRNMVKLVNKLGNGLTLKYKTGKKQNNSKKFTTPTWITRHSF